MMGIIDFIILLVVIISGFFALYRGLVRELLSLVSWVLAVLGAFYGLSFARPLFRQAISNPTIADIVASILIALVILVVCTIVNAHINTKLRKSALSGLDRILGFFFGVLRGVLLIICVYFFASFALSDEKMEKYANHNISLEYLKKTSPTMEEILPNSLLRGLTDMQKKEDAVTKIKEEKEKQEGKDAKEESPYDRQDLESMDVLMEAIE